MLPAASVRGAAYQATRFPPTVLLGSNLLSVTFSGLLSKDFWMVGSIKSLNSEWDMYRSRGAQLSYKEKGVRYLALLGTDQEQRIIMNRKFNVELSLSR